MSKLVRATLAIAVATFLEAVRNRLLLVALVFVLVLVGLSVAAASVAVGEQARLIVDVGLAAASGLGSLMTIALGVASFGAELTRHTAFPVLARPIPRWCFVVGKHFGIAGTMVLITTVMILATAGVVVAYGEAVPRAIWSCLALNAFELALVAAVTVLFTTFAVPVLAATYSAGVVIAGNLATDVARFAAKLEADGKGGAELIRGAYYVLPDLQNLSARIQAANDLSLPPRFVLHGALYASAYTACALLLACWIFTRRKAI